jgi:hypothetical protein
MQISEITRRDIFDAIQLENFAWSGRLEESEFLSRLYDLNALPSSDPRYSDASDDIWKHRVANNDWDDYWIFTDSRFLLHRGDDEILLRFLCETIHPVVRPDPTEAQRLLQLYNQLLGNDGFRLVEKTRISGRPVYVGRQVGIIQAPGLSAAKQVLVDADAGYVAQQITRMEAAVTNDPFLAIGTAKELVETCCKTILAKCEIEIPKSIELPKLVKLTCKELNLTPADISDQKKAAETIKVLLSNLAAITQGIAELRNSYGTGHGKDAKSKGLSSRHAKLAVGAASTLSVFLIETHEERSVSEDNPA